LSGMSHGGGIDAFPMDEHDLLAQLHSLPSHCTSDTLCRCGIHAHTLSPPRSDSQSPGRSKGSARRCRENRSARDSISGKCSAWLRFSTDNERSVRTSTLKLGPDFQPGEPHAFDLRQMVVGLEQIIQVSRPLGLSRDGIQNLHSHTLSTPESPKSVKRAFRASRLLPERPGGAQRAPGSLTSRRFSTPKNPWRGSLEPQSYAAG